MTQDVDNQVNELAGTSGKMVRMEKGLELNLDWFSPKSTARVSTFSQEVKKHHTVSFSKEDTRRAFNNNTIDDDDNKTKERIKMWNKQQNSHNKDFFLMAWWVKCTINLAKMQKEHLFVDASHCATEQNLLTHFFRLAESLLQVTAWQTINHAMFESEVKTKKKLEWNKIGCSHVRVCSHALAQAKCH